MESYYLANSLWLIPIERILSFLASSVTYIRLGGILLLSQFFFLLTPIEGILLFLASSVTYIHLGRILLLSPFFFLTHASHWLNSSFITLFQTWIHLSTTSTNGIVSNTRYSIVMAVSSHPTSPGDSCLAWNNGWLCRVLPKLDRASLELGSWWQVWLCARRGLQY